MNIKKSEYVLITGSSSDIGSAICHQISKHSNIVIHARDRSKALELKKEIVSKYDIRIWIYDFRETAGIENSLGEFLDFEDILISSFVHCSAMLRILPIKNFRIDYYEEIFNVNFFSSIEILKVILKKSNLQSMKSILYLSALYSKFGSKGNSIYAASKGAIDSFVKSLAIEVAPVRVNSILPGAIETQMTKHLFEDPKFINNFNSRYLLGRGFPEDVAELVDFLISEKAKWITGQSILIDGGASICLS